MEQMPSPLVDPEWLEARLGDPALRLYDVSVVMRKRPDGGFEIRPAEAEYAEAHVPGAAFVDLAGRLSAPADRLLFTLPGEDAFADAMSAYGLGQGHHAVLYNRGPTWWSTRLWFMLEHFGFDRASVLDGGFDRWQAEGRPVRAGVERYPGAEFPRRPGRPAFVGRQEVVTALRTGGVSLMNCLSRAQHRGEVNPYGRPGHIPGSRNLTASELLDEQQSFRSADALEAAFAEAGVERDKPVIAYCGGGISATTNAFALRLLGHEDVQVYDGSMSEWARDPSLPLETGD